MWKNGGRWKNFSEPTPIHRYVGVYNGFNILETAHPSQGRFWLLSTLAGTTVELDLDFEIGAQPDDVTCGPTSLAAVYSYHNDHLPLDQVIAEIPQLESGGTLAVQLACHALRRGYSARLYTYNLHLFDPSWFPATPKSLARNLRAQMEVKSAPKLHLATKAYLDYLALGGELRHVELRAGLIVRYLRRGFPVLTGLSSTYLYSTMRELHEHPNSIRGEATGHFVVLCGYSRTRKELLVADPLGSNPLSTNHHYWIRARRVLSAILLGIITYDGNLLILKPPA